LIQNGGGDVNETSSNGMNLLAWAIYHNQIEIAKVFIQFGANIEKAKVGLKKYGKLKLIEILDKFCEEMK